MSVTHKGKYFLLSTDATLDDELSEPDVPILEPAPLHKRNIRGRTSTQWTQNLRRSHPPRVSSWRSNVHLHSRSSRTHTSVQMDMVPGIGMRQFDGVRWMAVGLDHRGNVDTEETVKCVISSVLFLAIVVTVVVVALVKNPVM